jgi:ribonucleoside-diphosphate reductase alpha chain
MRDYFLSDIAQQIWDTKYRYRVGDRVVDNTIEDSWWRIARGMAAAETTERDAWAKRFYDILHGFRFLPGGRIQAGAGTEKRVTLFNCFVMGRIEDSMDGIFDALKEGALTMQQGGGVGYDFSTLRPHGARARSSGAIASGPVSFMRIWDTTCATLLSTGARRGAMMATLRCDHPDVEAFIEAKQQVGVLRNFNLSVQVTDTLMQAVAQDAPWPLVFPADSIDGSGDTVMRDWSGYEVPVPCRIVRTVPARALWHKLMRAAYDCAEPGVLFVDHINNSNNLWYREHITATNPCGEIPLPPYGACNLGSVNLTTFVDRAFESDAHVDTAALESTVTTAIRLLDNVISLSRFPLPQQRDQALRARRIGLGVTGLADALVMLGLRYDSDAGRSVAAGVMRTICHAAYRASVALARERGSFPLFDRELYLKGGFIKSLPDDIRAQIAEHGIRNSHLTAIAPTGTISLLANNISSGIEPIYDYHQTRRVTDAAGVSSTRQLEDYAWRRYRDHSGETDPVPTAAFQRALDIDPVAHLDMQAALQPFVDSAISKTINVPETFPLERFEALYTLAWEKGLKGCTAFRPNPVTGAILQTGAPGVAAGPHCCHIDREAD